MGAYLDGELYVTGRLVDRVIIGGRLHYPQDIEATAEQASPIIRKGHVVAFSAPAKEVPGSDGVGAGERLVIIAERASGTRRADPGPAVEAVRAAVFNRHGVAVADVRLVAAGTIPRTTSGKLARRACRAAFLRGGFGEVYGDPGLLGRVRR